MNLGHILWHGKLYFVPTDAEKAEKVRIPSPSLPIPYLGLYKLRFCLGLCLYASKRTLFAVECILGTGLFSAKWPGQTLVLACRLMLRCPSMGHGTLFVAN